ncbi:MAG: FlgD immunoglobulin-like domain containing protein [Candidatus Latescibacterota bacterium]
MTQAAPLLCLLLVALPALAQPVRTFVLGGSRQAWAAGGGGLDPILLAGSPQRPELDTTNTPGGAIELDDRPGWISPLHFDPDTNVAARVLEEGGSITAPNAVEDPLLRRLQLAGTVNGDHRVAFERKPTRLSPNNPLGIWIILDFGTPLGIQRLRFYPRNSVVSTPTAPFEDDFLRAFEVWVNETQTRGQTSPDVLVERRTANEQPVVEIDVPPQYARLLKLKSLTEVPWEIDEIEVYATGYLPAGTYVSDLIDLGDRATLGRVEWQEEVVGRPLRSAVSVQARTGTDGSPLVYHRRVLDSLGVFGGVTEVVSAEEWTALGRREKGAVEEDQESWSPWKTLENGGLMTAPGQRRYVQFRLGFEGRLFDARQVHWVRLAYAQPPLADTLRAEVYPRLVEPEQRATFRYAVLLRSQGPVRGYDRLEVDANASVEGIRGLTVNGEPVDFAVDFVRPDGFGVSFPRVEADSTLLEFAFDVPVFRFGTTFSGRAYNRAAPDLPQRLEAGNAVRFGPADLDELSELSVAIPRAQVGRLVGKIVLERRLFTPNGDGINDEFAVLFNLLQLTRPTPVILEIHDLSGRLVHRAPAQERSVGPSRFTWDGRLGDAGAAPPGQYVWLLRVRADAFEERHAGTVAVVY